MQKKKKLELFKQNRGITLISLVITIIVLLILAGVAINLMIGENGIFKTAQIAAQNYTNAQEKEIVGLTEFSNTINNTIEDIRENKLVTGITLDKTTINIGSGSSETITATVTPINARNKDIKWESSDTKVVTVSEGTITAKAAGNAIISATAQDGSGVSASCNVTVEIIVGSTLAIKTEYNPQNIYWQVVSNDDTTVNLVAKDPIGNLTLVGTNNYGGQWWSGLETLKAETSKYYIYKINNEKCEGKPIDSNIWNLMPDSLKVGKYWTGIVWSNDDGWEGSYRL